MAPKIITLAAVNTLAIAVGVVVILAYGPHSEFGEWMFAYGAGGLATMAVAHDWL